MQSILFTNWADDVFVHTWDNQEFRFEPGQSIYLQDYLAKHFAKHLANRELMRQDDQKFHGYVNNENNPVFCEYRDRALSQAKPAASEVEAQIDVLNRPETKEPKKSKKSQEIGSDINPEFKQ